MKKNLVIMGMISALLSSPFSSILACENESVWSMAASDKKPDPEKMREKMDSMMQAYDAAVKEILSDEQYEQFQAYREKNRPKGRPGHRPEMNEPDREFEDEMF